MRAPGGVFSPRLGLLLVVGGAALLCCLSPILRGTIGGVAELNRADPGADTTAIAVVPNYAVHFESVGLPSGANWSVSIAGETWNTTSPTLMVTEPNGTYAFSAYSAAAPAFRYINASFTVSGAPLTVPLDWGTAGVGAPSASSGPGSSFLLGGEWLVLLLVVIVVTAIAGALGLSRRSRTVVSPPPSPSRRTIPGGERTGAARPEGSEETEEDPLAHML